MIKFPLLKLAIALCSTSLSLLSLTAIEQQLFINESAIRVSAKTADQEIANQVYKKVNPAVVTIKAGRGHGSGFVVSKDGLVFTNAHVVADAPSVVTVEFSDGRQVPADVLGFAKGGLDLAALRINNQKNLTAVTLGNLASAEVGDRVFAIGTPLKTDNKNTFTIGNISRIDKKRSVIQHSANISYGNSGGPLVNDLGQVIGVNTETELNPVLVGGINLGVTPATGMAFAISVDKIKSFWTAVRQNQLSSQDTLPKPGEVASPKEISLNGQVVKGNLSQEDSILPDDSYADAYLFEGRAGQQVTLEMNSQQFNPSLKLYRLEESNGTREVLPVAENDDRGAGSFDAQITTALPEEGVYLVLATSSQPGEVGNYSLGGTATP
ncbi:MAG TPA: serine protease [Oculatellaceae cyanobacterium]|jgi:serine protease Do